MANLNARALRWTMTDAERRLWALLRRRQLQGYRFRRQHAVEPYILDFYCMAEKLAVELDGSQHGSEEGLAYDARRDAFLATRAIRVLRFPNADVFRWPDEVVDRIARALQGEPF